MSSKDPFSRFFMKISHFLCLFYEKNLTKTNIEPTYFAYLYMTNSLYSL